MPVYSDNSRKQINSLFIAYYGIEEPLIQSQGIPYLRELSKYGINFTILSFQKKIYSKEKEKEIFQKIESQLKEYGIKWYHLRYHKRPSLIVTPLDILCGFFYSIYIILKERIDVLHPRTSVPAIMVFPLAIVFRKKFIFELRGLLAREYVDGGRWPKFSLQYLLVNFLEKRISFVADAVVVLTEELKRVILQEKYALLKKGTDVTVIPCCVDLKKFEFAHGNGKAVKNPAYIYTGSVGNWYLTEEMIDFFRVAKSRNSGASFTILANNDIDYVKTIIKEKGLDISDFTIRSVFHEEIPKYLAAADVGIIFDKPGFSRKANSPTKFAEYLATGIPVIINYGIGDTEEIVAANNIGVVVRNFSDKDYAYTIDKMRELLSDSQVHDRCRKVAEEYYSLESGVKKYSGIYNKLFLKGKAR